MTKMEWLRILEHILGKRDRKERSWKDDVDELMTVRDLQDVCYSGREWIYVNKKIIITNICTFLLVINSLIKFKIPLQFSRCFIGDVSLQICSFFNFSRIQLMSIFREGGTTGTYILLILLTNILFSKMFLWQMGDKE